MEILSFFQPTAMQGIAYQQETTIDLGSYNNLRLLYENPGPLPAADQAKRSAGEAQTVAGGMGST